MGSTSRDDDDELVGVAFTSGVPVPDGGDPVERALVELDVVFWSIGDAYSALDRGYEEAASAVFASAPERVRSAWARAPDQLAALLPRRAAMLASGDVDGCDWYAISDEVKAALARHRAGR